MNKHVVPVLRTDRGDCSHMENKETDSFLEFF